MIIRTLDICYFNLTSNAQVFNDTNGSIDELNFGMGFLLLLATQPSLKIIGYSDGDYSYDNSYSDSSYGDIIIAHTQPTINHMSVEQVHLKDSL